MRRCRRRARRPRGFALRSWGGRSGGGVGRGSARASTRASTTPQRLACVPGGEGWERKPKVVPGRVGPELAGRGDPRGVVGGVEPYRYADAYELAGGDEPLLVCLDQVTDPRNLGAVCRSAEGAGATGVVLPAHGTARVTAAVCRASAGAVEHLPVAVVTNLARYLGEVKGPSLWAYAAAADATTEMWDADLSGGLAFVFGAEGRGLRPLVRRTCDEAVRIPVAGRTESLNVSVAAALLLYEARRQRG